MNKFGRRCFKDVWIVSKSRMMMVVMMVTMMLLLLMMMIMMRNSQESRGTPRGYLYHAGEHLAVLDSLKQRRSSTQHS